MHKHCLLVISSLLISLLAAPVLCAQEELQGEIASIMRDLEYLHSKGLEVKPIIEILNKAIETYYEGNIAEAREYLKKARYLVEELKPVAETVYLINLLTKVCTAAALASVPLIVYFALPRLYLYLWFVSHKKWVVRR